MMKRKKKPNTEKKIAFKAGKNLNLNLMSQVSKYNQQIAILKKSLLTFICSLVIKLKKMSGFYFLSPALQLALKAF